MSDFHLVDISPWPLMMSLATANSILSIYIKMNFLSCLLMFSMTMVYVFFLWSRDITRESTYQGMHPNKVQLSLKYGMILFITSEVMFFLSFFWTFFHSALNPTNEIGNSWPSWGVEPINPFGIPLLNTLVLVSSGVSVTYAHHSMLNQNYNRSIIWVVITVLLGGYFTILQFMEYVSSSFSIMDSVYGSIFFISTGFHGIHVLVGTLMILFSLARLYDFQFSFKHHLMFEFSCWYWHFVDLIWLFLFISIYWWGF